MHTSKKFILVAIPLLLIGAIFELLSDIKNGNLHELLSSAGFLAMAGSYVANWPKGQPAGQPYMVDKPNKLGLALSLCGTALLITAFGMRRGWF